MSRRLRSPELSLGASIWLALACSMGACSSAPAEITTPTPTILALPPATATPVPAMKQDHPAVHVLYEEDWFGGVELLGVDVGAGRAVVRLAGQNPERVYIDTIDLAKGQRVERWEITDPSMKKAIGGAGFPPSDAIRGDVLKFASIIATLGPWHMRPALPSPTFATSVDRSVVLLGSPASDGSSGDWLLALGSEGTPPRRVDEGLSASYSPVIGPDGKMIAFRGCSTSPCDYGVYIGEVGHKPRRLMGITGSTPPVFTKDGSHVLAVGDGLHRSRCVVKAPTNGRTAADPVFCVRGATEVAFVQDREGRTGIASAARGTPGNQSVDFTWILLEDGSVLQSRSVERATGGGIVNGAGLLALPMQKGGLAVVDLVGEKAAAFIDDTGWFFGFDTAAFADDALVLLRKPDVARSYQIVRVDARSLVDTGSTRRDPPKVVP